MYLSAGEGSVASPQPVQEPELPVAALQAAVYKVYTTPHKLACSQQPRCHRVHTCDSGITQNLHAGGFGSTHTSFPSTIEVLALSAKAPGYVSLETHQSTPRPGSSHLPYPPQPVKYPFSKQPIQVLPTTHLYLPPSADTTPLAVSVPAPFFPQSSGSGSNLPDTTKRG